ncbi:MAG: RecX family transcriptional regulator [Chitinophagaceae bacterium]|nr:RecX family transcriptional regulator [Chitinophagaceae bacterium]
MKLQNRITGDQAILKIKHYCAYQERSHNDVMGRLYEWGLFKREVDEIVAHLIGEGYLNEERFAIQFAGGKFRIKQWGKKKIEQALKGKQVSSYCIKKALAQLDDEDYRKTLSRLSDAKWKQLKGEKNRLIKMKKLQDFLLQKGYEYELVKLEVTEVVRQEKEN